jgi:hypothetical protein
MKRSAHDEDDLAPRDNTSSKSASVPEPEPYFLSILDRASHKTPVPDRVESEGPPAKKFEADVPRVSEAPTPPASKPKASDEYLEFNKETIDQFKLDDDARLNGAFQVIIACPAYRRVLAEIVTQGGVQIRLDDAQQPAGAWNSRFRTITVNPGRMKEQGHTMVGVLAFELMNARQDGDFQALLKEVREGRIRDPDDYARRAEQIEYNSAALRASASLKMIQDNKWTTADDPQLRHFLKKGKKLKDLVGTGLWVSFEGYLETQQANSHYDGQKERFAILAPADVKEELEKVRKIEEERKKFEQRKRQRELEAAKKNTIFTKDPSKELSKAGYTAFLEATKGGSFEGKQFETNDGRTCRVLAANEDQGEYTFRIL